MRPGSTTTGPRARSACGRQTDNGFPFQTGFAGGIKGLTIDGSLASAGAIGLDYGDLNDGRLDLAIQHFNLAGSVGLRFRNTVNWTEKTHCRARLYDNTINVQFTVTDGSTQTGVTLASASGGTATFTIASGSWPSDFSAGVRSTGRRGSPPRPRRGRAL